MDPGYFINIFFSVEFQSALSRGSDKNTKIFVAKAAAPHILYRSKGLFMLINRVVSPSLTAVKYIY